MAVREDVQPLRRVLIHPVNQLGRRRRTWAVSVAACPVETVCGGVGRTPRRNSRQGWERPGQIIMEIAARLPPTCATGVGSVDDQRSMRGPGGARRSRLGLQL